MKLTLALLVFFVLMPCRGYAISSSERCQSAQLKAAGGHCSRRFNCSSKFVKEPAKDLGRLKLSNCNTKADSKFLQSYGKAIADAVRKNSSCALNTSGSIVRDDLVSEYTALINAILINWANINKIDNKLHSSVLKTAGSLCRDNFNAESSDARKPNPGRLASQRSKKRSSFLNRAIKAENNASRNGVTYDGLDKLQIANRIDGIVSNLSDLSVPTASFSVTGTITAAEASFVDGDVNDINAPFIFNGDFDNAQTLPFPAALGGYVNLPGTGPTGASRQVGDISDFFQVSLAVGQIIALEIDAPSADLDLFLYNENGVLVDSSLGVTANESIIAPSSGLFFIEVFAFSGGSSYVLTLGQVLPSSTSRSFGLKDNFVPGEVIIRMNSKTLNGSKALNTGAYDSIQSIAQTMAMTGRAGAPNREVLLALKDGVARNRTFSVLGVYSSYQILSKKFEYLTPQQKLKMDTILAVKALKQRTDVASVDLNYIRKPSLVPDDSLYNLQWHYPLVNLPQAWDITTGDSSVKIAVIDTGVLLSHPDLQGKLTAGYDFISDVSNAIDGDGIDANPNDPGDKILGGQSSFHGTHVAGTIAAATNNNRGVAGIIWNGRIIPLRVIGQFGASDFDIIQAVRFAAGLSNNSGITLSPSQRADIINLSLGGPGFSQALQNVFNLARNQGVIVVAAAGNNSSSTPQFPAANDGVISVSAIDMHKDLAPYSSFGNTIDVAAPGGDETVDRNGDGFRDGVLSTLGDDSRGSASFNYVFYQGTSMATPHVAGIAALMKSVAPTRLTPAQMDLLLASGTITTDLGASGRDNQFGHGLIDARAAVEAALNLENGVLPADNPILGASPLALNFGAVLNEFAVDVNNVGTGPLAITNVSEDSSGWLSVDPISVDTNGLGSYRIRVNRGDLLDGTYSATIIFNSNINVVVVPVVMNVGGLTISDPGFHFVILIDPTTFTTIAQDQLAAVNGTYNYQFTDVPAGEYHVIAGTDLDNDTFLCHTGEACGGFPTRNLLDTIVVNTDRSNIDFVTGFVNSFESVTATTGNKRDSMRQGIRRLESVADPTKRFGP